VKPSRFLTISILFSFTALISGIQESRIGHFKNTINVDGIGYYAWLPATFIYGGDYNWQFKDSVLSKIPTYQDRVQFFTYPDSRGKQINKYSCGLAATALPFWTVAYGVSKLSYSHVTGFEKPFQVAMWLNNLFWLLLGLIVFLNLLQSLGYSLKQQLTVAILLLFGTNLFHFITFDNTFTHPVNLGMLLMFIASCYRFLIQGKEKWLWVLCVTAMAVLLLRPVNVLLLFIILFPFLNAKTIRPFIRVKYSLIFLTSGFTALFLYGGSLFVQSGNWTYYSYNSEGFDFSKSQFWQLLIGYRCGLFLYTPMALFFFWFLYKCSWRTLTKCTFVLLIAAVVYLFSAWIDPCFGCRVGNRPLIDYYSAFLLPLLWVKPQDLKFRNPLLWLLPLFFLFYNQVLHYQYRHYLIDWCYMDGPKFKSSFLRLSK
jgi:hypothetical protein